MQAFARIDLAEQPVPDETTVCRFRHLLERHQLGAALFAAINEYLARQSVKLSTGTIVDATIISAPPSTKNKDKARDPDMHQTKKGNQWYFGMKGHFGVDAETKVIHSVAVTAANVHDGHLLGDLLHGGETEVWGDTAYQGKGAGPAEHAPSARDLINRRYRRKGIVDEVERGANRAKSSVRARVEHSIGVIKRVFSFVKVRYRGLDKNANRLFVACGLVNLYMARRQLL